MRDEKGQFIKGHTGNPLGRPKRADEQLLLDIWDEYGRNQFVACVERGEPWALRTLMDKLFANRKPSREERSSMMLDGSPLFAEYNLRESTDLELYEMIAENTRV